MRAAVYHGRGDVRVEQRPRPDPKPGEVLLRVTRSGICGTDAGEFAHGPRMFPIERRHPASGHLGPMALGHEFVGEVIAAGPDLPGSWSGRRLASGAGVSCARCDWCRAGRTNLCARYWTLGLSADGGLAEYVSVPVTTCVEIPAGCSDDAAGLAQPLAVGLHAVRRAGVRAAGSVVLIRAGAIGSFILCGLRTSAAGTVLVLDVDDSRLATARLLGATHAVNVRAHDPIDAVRELTDGVGADVVIEASGAPGNAQRAIRMTARGGQVLLVGLPHEPQALDVADATLREVDLRTTAAHVCGEDMPAALDLLTTHDIAQHLLDRVIPLERVVEDGLAAILAGTVRGTVLIDPHA
jgi:(R,R)-butanediol dehydrogenase / meso-butanediol dehydrogenase / diacetyl reductase